MHEVLREAQGGQLCNWGGRGMQGGSLRGSDRAEGNGKPPRVLHPGFRALVRQKCATTPNRSLVTLSSLQFTPPCCSWAPCPPQSPVFAPVSQAVARRMAYHTFAHVLHLDTRFHLDRRTGRVSRILERGGGGHQSRTGDPAFSQGFPGGPCSVVAVLPLSYTLNCRHDSGTSLHVPAVHVQTFTHSCMHCAQLRSITPRHPLHRCAVPCAHLHLPTHHSGTGGRDTAAREQVRICLCRVCARCVTCAAGGCEMCHVCGWWVRDVFTCAAGGCEMCHVCVAAHHSAAWAGDGAAGHQVCMCDSRACVVAGHVV